VPTEHPSKKELRIISELDPQRIHLR